MEQDDLELNADDEFDRSDLWLWFGLSYAAFLVLPRVSMHMMPEKWQKEMSELLHQYDETINKSAFGVHGCLVQAVDENNRFMSMPEQLKNYRHPSSETKQTLLK